MIIRYNLVRNVNVQLFYTSHLVYVNTVFLDIRLKREWV